MGVLLVTRWLWWRINAWGELAAIFASLVLAPLLLATVPAEHEALRLLVMAVGSTAAGIIATLATPAVPLDRLCAFYERAAPPGFWKPVARCLGRDDQQAVNSLVRALSATALAACSVFSLLTGLGSWLVGSPPPTWFPYSNTWIGGLLVLGTGLIPIWWKLAFRR